MKSSKLYISSLVAGACLFAAQSASAVNNCNIVTNTKAKTQTLQASCSTDATMVVPAGYTFVGQGFKITAKDPAGGNFQGPILTNGGSGFKVDNLFLRTSQTEMADVCNTGSGRIVGILANNTIATITNVNITMNKGAGASVCEEGVAIRAEGTGSSRKVTIKNATLNYNQLAGVEFVGNGVNGRVEASIIKNLEGNPVPQRGVVIAQGAKGYIINNQIIRHLQVPLTSNPSYGVLLDNAGATTVIQNTLNKNDYAIALRGGKQIVIRANIIRESTFDGILVTDILGTVTSGNVIWANDSRENGGNGIYFQATQDKLEKNTAKYNIVRENVGHGLLIEGRANKIQSNEAFTNNSAGPANSGFVDIFDGGIYAAVVKNNYTGNTCATSSFPHQIKCGVVP